MNRFNKKLLLALCMMCSGFGAKAQDTLMTIQEAIATAVEQNFDVRISKNETEIGSISNSWAAAGALPVVNASANKRIAGNHFKQKLSNGSVTEKKNNTSQNFNAGIEVNWKIFDGFRMFATKRRLEELERFGEYAFRKTLNETLYDVITSYYNIVLLQEQLQATREQIALYNDRLFLAQRRFEIGTGAKYEVLEAKVDLNEQRSALLSLQNAIAVAKSSLRNLMGVPADTNYIIADTIRLHTLPPMGDVLALMSSQNPDVLMANSQLIMLHETKKEINSERLPSVTLIGDYNFVRNRSSAGFNLFNQTYGPSGAVGISIPLFNGAVVKKQLQITDIQIRNQQLTMQQLALQLNTEIQNAYINYASALKTIALEKNNLELATENIMIATERYKKLSITAVELRQVQISYLAAKYRLYNALYQAKMAEATIALLTGKIGEL